MPSILSSNALRRFFLLLGLILAAKLSFAQGFNVQNFTADIYLRDSGYLDIVERYDLGFTQAKHGIFKEIVNKFDFKDEDGIVTKRELYISNITVSGAPFTTNKFFGMQLGDRLKIRIGDKNVSVIGDKQYEIHYRVKNALIFTNDLVQLYWNIKPEGWSADFRQVNFTIHTPQVAVLSAENCFVYSGNTGNAEPSKEFQYHYTDSTFSGNSKADFHSYQGQNVTVLVKLPKTIVSEVDFTPPFWNRYGWMGIIALPFLLIFTFIIKRNQYNKVVPVTSYYPPEGIDPAMAGVLIDNTPDTRDITCLLPYWATKGYVRLEEVEERNRALNGELKFIKIKELPNQESGYELDFFHKIFAGKDEVYAKNLRSIIMEPLGLLAKKSEQFYNAKRSSLRKLKLIVFVLSELWAFFSITFLPFWMNAYTDINSFWFILFIIINFIFFFAVFPFLFAYVVNQIRAKNEKGKLIMPELLGFYQFIKLAEVERIKMLLKEDFYYFEKTMPYAIAFDLLKEWTAKFEGLIVQSPEWYSGSAGSHFSFNVFASSFNNNMAALKSTMVTSPSRSSSSSHSSSGGGFSGGGAGSGGGGSW